MDQDALLDYHYGQPRFRGVSGQHQRADNLQHLELDFTSPNPNNDPFAQWQPQQSAFDPFGHSQAFSPAPIEQHEVGFSQPYNFNLGHDIQVDGLGFDGLDQSHSQNQGGMIKGDVEGDVFDDMASSRRNRRLSVRAEVSQPQLQPKLVAHLSSTPTFRGKLRCRLPWRCLIRRRDHEC